nr:MMPL family transporter [Prolixibacteraceae bacterium]
MIEKKILKYKWWFIILPLIATVVAIIFLSQIQINSDLESYFPESMESKINAKKIEATFGKSEPLLLIFQTDDVLQLETLNRLKKISKEFNRMKCFDEVISLFDMKNIKGENGTMIVEPVIKRIPKSESKREKLRNEIMSNELVYKTVVSENFQYTLFILKVAKGTLDEDALSAINEVLELHPGNEKHYLNGMPFLRVESNQKISRDLMILLPVGLLLMIIFLFISFKEFRGVWIPFIVVVISTIVSMALLPIMGWDMSLIGVIIPIMMIAIANDYGVHFIARYQELNATKPDWQMDQIVTNTLQHLKKPIVLTGITTIVGVSGLLTHLMLPARQMGIISALGIAIALLLSLTFIPTSLSMLKKGKIQRE